jgi:hypothetical protein
LVDGDRELAVVIDVFRIIDVIARTPDAEREQAGPFNEGPEGVEQSRAARLRIAIVAPDRRDDRLRAFPYRRIIVRRHRNFSPAPLRVAARSSASFAPTPTLGAQAIACL